MENGRTEQTETAYPNSPATKFGELIGSAPAMAEVFALAKRVAPCDVSVLITGETGTGKELLARAIHDRSSRSSGPFVALSCANLPDTLIDDELFGHEKGAFTGAEASRRGRFEVANGGTLFLDEIGDLPLALQAKLLRVLQQRTFERVGGCQTVSADVRLICATHRDLEAMVCKGTFRQDLLYRLNVLQLQMPALRDRPGDIVPLAEHFLARFASNFGPHVARFSPESLRALTEYSWPGNVRELENVIQRAVALADTSSVELGQLPAQISGFVHLVSEPQATFDTSVREFKRRLIVRTLKECEGNKSRAARTLKLARPYLHRLMHELDLVSFAEAFREQRQPFAA